MIARVEAAQHREQVGLFALLGLWLVYTRLFAVLQAVHLTLPACPFYLLTGHPCPFCGGTRSYAAMWRGDLAAAVRYYPLGPALFALTFAALGYTAWSAVTGRRILLSPRLWRGLVAVGLAALAASWSLKLFWLGN